MQFQYSPYILPLIAAALVSAVVAVYAWTHRSMRGAKALSLLSLAIAIWAVGYSLEIAGADLATKYFWGVIQYIGIAFVPYIILIFSIMYSDPIKVIRRSFFLFTGSVPIITVLLAFTTKWHGLIWSEYHINRDGGFSALDVTHGPWFWIHFTYSYLLLLTGTILLARLLWRRQGLVRSQMIALLVALFAPWIGNALYLTGNSPIPYLDLTPFAFTVTVAALAWAVFGFHLVDIAPLARDYIVDSMQDGMIVLDMRGWIVDINPSAARMIGVSALNAVGRDARDVFSPWPHLIERFGNVMEADEEIAVGSNNAQRRFQARISPLAGVQGQPAGRLIMMRALGEGTPPLQTGVGDAIRSSDQPKVGAERSGSVRAEESGGASSGENPIWGAFVKFFFVPLKMNLVIQEGYNPSWYRTRERIFTVVARVAAAVGSTSLALSARDMFHLPGALLGFAVILILLWALGLARNVKYETRVTAFLFLVYSLGFVEAVNFGFSVECFVFFMSFAVIAAVMTSRRGAMRALAITIVTLGAFAVLIGSKNFIPLSNVLDHDFISPQSLQAGVNSLLVFTASALAVVSAIVILLENLNAAWQKETQALSLLQQEHDLLDQRVTARTRELTQAEAKYRLLAEGLPVVIYRDSADEMGKSIYINPQTEKMLGYSIAEWEHDPLYWWKIIHPEDRERVADAISQTLERGSFKVEYRLLARDGRVVWVRDDAVLVRDESGQPQYVQGILQDVTEQKRAEEGRLRSESKYTDLYNNTPTMYFTVDEDGTTLSVNTFGASQLGYTPQELIGQSVLRVFYEADKESAVLYVKKCLEHAGQLQNWELRKVRKDGSMLWVKETAWAVQNQEGKYVVFIACDDITVRKRAEDQIRKLSQAVEQSGSSIVITDINGSIEYVNPQFTKTTGYTLEEALGKNPRLLKSGEQSREFYEKLWKTLTAKQAWRGVFHNKRKDGSLYWESATIAPILNPDGAIANYVAVKEDITRQKEMEEALHQTHQTQSVLNSLLSLSLEDQTLEQMLDRALDIILTIPWLPTQPKGGIFLVEDQPNTLVLKSQQNLGAPLLTLCARVPFGHCLCGRAAANAKIEFADCVDERHDNRYIGIQPHGHYNIPILFREEVLGVLVLYLDHGRARDPHEADFLEAVANTLSAMIRDKQADEALAIARDLALEASAFKSQLLSRVSHELRTPLSGVLGYAELMQFDAFGALNEKQRAAAQNIVGSARYLDVLVNDLLDEAQIESRSIRLNHESFSPAKLLERTGASMSIMANNKGLSLRMELDPGLPNSITGDEGRLQQILFNLLGNAIKFTREGEVCARFTRAYDNQWAMQVSDTGAGIPEEARAYIFDPFRQVDNSITRENRGAGLGLSITKQLVELMGGTITLETEIGKGSAFTVLLPLMIDPREPV
ncbi:MAG: PAS domain S-box protein [Chloroflexi bacterium]|nr:PAS domain S-box protein [Chloroflexota bacterium]